MSEQNETTNETTTLTREDGTTYVLAPFSLEKTKEVADRFRGAHTINIPLPVAVPGDLEATLANLRAFVDPSADFGEVLVAKFVGQGLRLDTQKQVKDFLAPGDNSERPEDVGEAIAAAQARADSFRLGAPRTRSASGEKKGKVAAAEAKVAKVSTSAIEMYKALPRELREVYRPQLISAGSFTEEQLDEAEREADEAGGIPVTGGNRKGRREQ